MEPSSKFDAYLLSEIPKLKESPEDALISIGFGVDAQNVESMIKAKKDIGALFSDGRAVNARMASAHWPATNKALKAFVTADVTRAQLSELAKMPEIVEIQLCASPEVRRALVPRKKTGMSKLKAVPILKKGTKKILGLIDHGCPFAHRALRDEKNRSLVHAIWDQDTRPDFPENAGTTPEGYFYGRQVTRGQLSKWIYPVGSTGPVNEDECYLRAQYSAMRTRVSHGSLVLGMLVNDRLEGNKLESIQTAAKSFGDTNCHLVFVQLPRSVPLSPNRGSVERYVLDGVKYIVDCAPKGSEVEVVLDYGTDMGPHDGSSWFERGLDHLVAMAHDEKEVKLVPISCAGNSFEAKRLVMVDPTVSLIAKNAKTVTEFSWVVPPGNDTKAYVELWTQENNKPTLSIRPPFCADEILVDLGCNQSLHWPKTSDPLKIQCSVVTKHLGKNRTVLISIAPTGFDPVQVTAPSGSWRFKLEWKADQSIDKVYGYTHWGGNNIGFPKRTGSPWFSAHPTDLLAKRVVIDGNGSAWGSACGDKVLVAGSYQAWGPKARAKYSGSGATRSGKLKPDFLLITEEAPSLHGVLGLGHRSGTLVRVNGTSFAAPQLARYFQQGKVTLSGPSPGFVIGPTGGGLKVRGLANVIGTRLP